MSARIFRDTDQAEDAHEWRSQVGRLVMALAPSLLLLGTVLAGCTVITSETLVELADRGKAPSGVKYCLPKSIMEFRLSANPEKIQFTVTPSEPRSIRDLSRCYYMNYRPAPQSDDIVSVTTSKNGYLKSVTATTTDKTIDIIKDLAKAVGALGLEAARTPIGDDLLASETVDPTDSDALAKAEHRLATALKRYAKAKADTICKKFDPLPPSPPAAPRGGGAVTMKVDKAESDTPPGIDVKSSRFDLDNKIKCDEFKSFAEMQHPISLKFTRYETRWVRDAGRPVRESAVGVPVAVKVEPDCRVGLCYRVPEAWLLDIGIGEVILRLRDAPKGKERYEPVHEGVRKALYMMPNRSRLVEIDIRRAFLVNKVQSITFSDEGFLDTVQVTKPSEFAALSSIPLEILSAIADGLAIGVTYLENQTKDADAERALIEARTALQHQRALIESVLTQTTVPGVTTASRLPTNPAAAQPLSSATVSTTPDNRIQPVDPAPVQ